MPANNSLILETILNATESVFTNLVLDETCNNCKYFKNIMCSSEDNMRMNKLKNGINEKQPVALLVSPDDFCVFWEECFAEVKNDRTMD